MNDHIHKAGDVVGERYDVLAYLGEGGMQQVFRGRDKLLDRDVAVKVPKNLSAQKRFKRSAVVSAMINHANVAKTLDYVEDGGRTYLVEEMISGRDLSLIRADHLSFFDPHLAARLLHHLAKGLRAAHHAKVVHRDLKPSNVMVVGGNRLLDFKITDFGIAKMAEAVIAEAAVDEKSLNASVTAMGAIPYMSPEALRSLKDAKLPADVWAIGAIAYEFLTGDKPFGAGFVAVKNILDGNPPPVPSIVGSRSQFRKLGEELMQIILTCMTNDPAKRPTADELVSACEALCYSNYEPEVGTIRNFVYPSGTCGFIERAGKSDVFFHQDSYYGVGKLKIGERVSFGTHVGGGAYRAFPILRCRRFGK